MTPEDLRGIIRDVVSEELAAGVMTEDHVRGIFEGMIKEHPHLMSPEIPHNMVGQIHGESEFKHPADELSMLDFMRHVHTAGNPKAGMDAKQKAFDKLIPLERDLDQIPVGLYDYVPTKDEKGNTVMRARLADPAVVKTLYTGSDAAGGYLVPTQQETTLINLINYYAPLPSLCNQVPMTRKTITIPTATGGFTGYWIPEATDATSLATQSAGAKQASIPTFGQLSLTSHVAAVRVFVTNQLIWDSDPSIEPILQRIAAEALGDLFDTAILQGTGAATDPISGLDTLISTNSIPAGVVFDFDDIIDGMVVEDYVKGNPTIYIVGHNKARRSLMKIKDNDGQYLYKGPVDGGSLPSVWGNPFVRDNNVSTALGGGTDTKLYMGPLGQSAHVGRRMGLRAFVNPYSYAYGNIVEYIFEMRVGFTVSAENHFSEITGVPTTS